jgi:NAD(P)H-hydrate epimerase
MTAFNPQEIKNLFTPDHNSSGEDNGQVVIIGGSELFHGAPLLALKVASRIVDMVFFTSPEKSVGMVAENLKSKLLSFVWIPWDEVNEYVEKADVILIGPGFMRFRSEKSTGEERTHLCDDACRLTKEVTKGLLLKYPDKKWVIDAGSLQVMDPQWIPTGSIITPNKKEFAMLYGQKDAKEISKEKGITIVVKGPVTHVYTEGEDIEITNGNPGLTKGGTGDTLAGLAVALFAKNDARLSACAASYLTKAAADKLYEKVGTNYNSDDLANTLPEVVKSLQK